MNRGLISRIGETIDQYRSERQAHGLEEVRQGKGTQISRLLRWFLPNGGTLLLIGLLIFTQNVWARQSSRNLTAENAASTGTIAYQGRLADTAGTPLTQTVGMEFRLYAQASGGAPLWTETWTGTNSVAVSDGLFNVMLGSLTPIPQEVLTGSSSLFLGVTVGTDSEMAPRVQLGSVPYAIQALTVPDASITTAKLNIDGPVEANYNALKHALVWPATYDGDGTQSVLPGFMDTLYYATRRTNITVSSNRAVYKGSLASMFNLHPNSRAVWTDVTPSNPVTIDIEFLGKGYLLEQCCRDIRLARFSRG